MPTERATGETMYFYFTIIVLVNLGLGFALATFFGGLPTDEIALADDEMEMELHTTVSEESSDAAAEETAEAA